MRFLLGLVLGAVLVLALAEGLGAETSWRERWSTLTEYWQSLTAAPASEDASARPPPFDPVPMAAAPEPARPEPARQPIPRPPDPRPVDDPLAGSGEPAPQGGSEAEALAPAAANDNESENVQELVAGIFGPGQVRGRGGEAIPDRGADDEPEVPDAAPARPEAPAGSHPVWVPFHSEMSATGFAERLTESLNHPFRVERRGPGRYQVVFGYADEQARQSLLAEAAAATGLPL